MSKVITFSQVYPSYHPRKGQKTDFVGKIWESIYLQYPEWLGDHYEELKTLYSYIGLHGMLPPKHHTIRAGHRFKVGDKFSPRVWSGKPYQSKQITIAPDIEVQKIWTFKIEGPVYWFDGYAMTLNEIKELANNDGLDTDDFECWFNVKEFDGQVICWNGALEY
jgi:hypothetical protein